MILDQLRSRGADLTKPRSVRNHLYFHAERTARDVAAQLSKGYRTSVTKATDGSGDWLVTAEKVMVVNMTTIAASEAYFDHITPMAGGTYDGWEAAATP